MTALTGVRAETVARPKVRASRVTVVFVGLSLGLAVMVLVAAGRGQLDIPPGEVFASILHRVGNLFGLDIGSVPTHPQGENALWQVRFPRVALGVVVGAALASAGAMMQGVFGNPLAEPGVVGVSAGAALAASSAIAFGITVAGVWTIPIFAFLGGLVTTLLVYLMSRDGGRTEVVTLVLTGIAVNAVAQAGMALVMFMADTQAREQIVFWTLGSLNGTRWQYVGVVAPLCLAGIVGAMVLSRQLDLLSLGDRAARHVGVDVERLRIISIFLVAVLTAAAVSFCGVIGFVGLVVPHLVRIVLGPGHRLLIPASALGGALLLVSADLFARTLVQYADLPIGMLTALVGGPFFFWLLRRTRRTAGGWA
ncbi:MAG: hemin transporter permease [Marmoricola sp.]|nr:hemin transporter permease [Marmoricola sp.]